MSYTYTTIIKGLNIDMFVGIHDFEKKSAQRVLIDVEVFSLSDSPPQEIGECVNYESIVNKIKVLCAAQHYDLVEALGEAVANICLQYDQASRVCVCVRKPDIINDCDYVGVNIERSKTV